MVSTTSLVLFVILSIFLQMTFCQRSPYAGSRPTGYKDRFVNKTNVNNSDNEIVNRFGGPDLNATQKPPISGVPIVYGESIAHKFSPQSSNNFQSFSSIPSNNDINIGNSNNNNDLRSQQQQQQQSLPSKIPFDAYGDIDLVQRFNDVPVDHRPFWLINYEAIEAHRNRTSGNNFNTVFSRPSFLGK